MPHIVPEKHKSLYIAALLCSINIFFPQGGRGGSSLSASQMESTMKLLKGRVQSRLALTKQFASLGMLDVIVHNA